MTPAELFRRAGAALYGEQFVAPLAVALKVDKNTVGKWAAGKSDVPVGVWADIQELADNRGAELTTVADLVASHCNRTFWSR